MIPQKFRNSDLFELADVKLGSNYELYGLICFGNSHYISYFKSTDKDEHWVYYDDTMVSRIDQWKEVIFKSIKSHYHPTILLYRRLDSHSAYLTEDEELTDAEIGKWITWCSNYDKERESEAKVMTNSSRLRPSSDSKKLLSYQQDINLPKNYDEKQADLIKEYNGVSETQYQTTEGRTYTNPNYNQTTTVVGNNLKADNDEMAGNNNKNNSKEIYRKIKSDEWVCETKACDTINKNDTAQCSNCKITNSNILDLIVQKRLYANLQDPQTSSSKFKTQLGSELTTKKNIQELKDLKSHSCSFCQKDNYYKEKNCENCFPYNDKESRKTLNPEIKYRLNYEKNIIYWKCAFCKQVNKELKITCDICRKNKVVYVENPDEVKTIEQKYKVNFDKLNQNKQCHFCKMCNDQYACQGSLYCEICQKKRRVASAKPVRANPRGLMEDRTKKTTINSPLERLNDDLRKSGLLKTEPDEIKKEYVRKTCNNHEGAEYIDLTRDRPRRDSKGLNFEGIYIILFRLL
jgi:hypothetical protein